MVVNGLGKLHLKAILWVLAAFFCVLVYMTDASLLGLLTVAMSVSLAVNTRSFLVLVLSFFNVLLGIAFDYFLRVRPNAFNFYFSNGASVEFLCLLSLLVYMVIAVMDSPKGGSRRAVTIEAAIPQFSKLIFYPAVASILLCGVFILKNERTLLASTFDISDLNRYPFLEYFGLIAFFAIGAAQGERKRLALAYFSAIFLILVCLLTSYRMVAIVISMAVIFMWFRGRTISKGVFVALWAGVYVLLMLISYVRLGMDEIGAAALVGYVDGRLDNTFTGVIETALIYTGVSENLSLIDNLKHLVGTVLPVPSSFVPESFQYIVHVHNVHPGRLPGGGLLAGFFIYFHYLLAVPVFLFLYLAIRKSGVSPIYGVMYFVVFICVARWWLYGPFVFFKFIGVFAVLQLINLASLKYEGQLRRGRMVI